MRVGSLRAVDWFERLTGFEERGYEETRRKLEVVGATLRSRVNGKSYGIGELELVSLSELRARARAGARVHGRSRFTNIKGDVRRLHRRPEYAGAVFQVASQFNLLEMTGPHVSPEDGVTRYAHDHTQGPACAIAAGAATIYRNYFVPVRGGSGQTRERQLDGLADMGAELTRALCMFRHAPWKMRNGYALCEGALLDMINDHLRALEDAGLDALRALLRIGWHRDVEVTDGGEQGEDSGPQIVSQVFCSALPVAYCHDVPAEGWSPFAGIVLQAAYEATMWAAVLNAQRGASNVVLLTRLGGGAFGNDDDWIDAALWRALEVVRDFALDVRMVSYGEVPNSMAALEREFG